VNLSSTPLVQVSTKDSKRILVIRVPQYDVSDETTAKSMATVFNFALAVHNCSKENFEIVVDDSLGSGKLALSKSLLNLLASLTSSAMTPLGYFAGEDVKFPTGYVGNLPCMLSSMRLLNWKKEFLRKKKRLPEGVSPVAFYNLQEMFNSVSGLKSEEQKGWPVDVTRAILNSCIKVNNTGFPGGWIYQNRSKNHVKSDMALVQLLGWTPKAPSKEKLLEVLFNTVDEESTVGDDGKRYVTKRTIVNISKDKRPMSLPEYRAGVSMLLPRVNPASSEPLKEQVKVDSFSIKKESILKSYMADTMLELVDVLNDAHALRVSCKNPKSKTQPVHYLAARSRMLTLSSKVPLVDANGTTYESLKKIPEKTLKEFSSIFPYKVGPRRVTEVTPQQSAETAMVIEGQAEPSQPHVIPASKLKMTKGQAKETLRRSGRLARREEIRSRGSATRGRGGVRRGAPLGGVSLRGPELAPPSAREWGGPQPAPPSGGSWW
jgi:hypothetical protein